jgi:erythromycin esterase
VKNTIILFWLLHLFFIHSAISQEFQNLDFEFGQYNDQPVKWATEGSNGRVNLDSIILKTGKKSLHVNVKNGQIYVYLILSPHLIAGKTVAFTADLKRSAGDSVKGNLLLFNPSQSPVLSNDIPNNNNWNTMTHQAVFPKQYDSDRMLLGFSIQGSGNVWIDNVNIKIDGVNYGDGTPDFREPTNAEITILNKTVIPVSTNQSSEDEKELKPLNKLIGNAKIVGLGENSHGSSSIFKVKLRLVKYLVKNLGFTLFALEAPAVECDLINQYVLYGKGSKREVIQNLVYKGWQNEDILNIVEWIKIYNETAKIKVEFRGVDCQNSISALNYLLDVKKDNPLHNTEVKKLKQLFDYSLKEKKEWEVVYQQLYKVDSIYEIEKTSDKIKRYLLIFRQGLTFHSESTDYKLRDQYMADNVDWLIKHGRSNEKIIVSADNQHINKSSAVQGGYLNQMFGKDYVNIGFTYRAGHYAADGPEKVYEVHPPYLGTYEYFLSKSRFNNFIIDLRKNDIDYLNKKAGFRVIGSRPQEGSQFVEVNLKSLFDILIYLDKSEPTVFLDP